MDNKGKKITNKNILKDGVDIVVSKGVILGVKGKTAKNILAELENPKTNKKLLKDCSVMAKELTGTKIAKLSSGRITVRGERSTRIKGTAAQSLKGEHATKIRGTGIIGMKTAGSSKSKTTTTRRVKKK